jgi:peptide/nickel transport system substrate-binding protein
MMRELKRNRMNLGQQTVTRRGVMKWAAASGMGAGALGLSGPYLRSAQAALQETPVPGGTLNVGVAAELAVLDPHITTLAAYATTLRFTIFETLVEADETGQYIPSLADSWEFAEDGMSLTMQLVQGATFHNGKEFNAEDVIFTVNRIQDPSLASQFAPQVANIESIDAPDDHTVVLNFTAPTPAILDYLLNVQIVTEEGIDEIGVRPVGTGPFEFGEWALNDHITVRRFEGYRREGLPYLEEIIFRPILDVDTRLTNLLAGTLDLIEQPAPKDAERIEGDENLQLIVTPPTSKYDNFQINTLHEMTSDPRVRQALNFAFDRESYVRDILYGFGTPAISPFPQDNWAYDAEVVEPYMVFDLERSAQLLEEAGHPDGDGLDGLEILTPLGYPELMQAAVLLQANLSTIGVNASVRELEIAAWVDRIATQPDFMVTTDTYGYGDVDPSTFFTRDNLDPDLNIHQFTNEEYKSLVERGATTIDQEERREIYSQIQQILMDEMPGFLIAHRQDFFAAKQSVQGFNPGPLIRHHYEETWISES